MPRPPLARAQLRRNAAAAALPRRVGGGARASASHGAGLRKELLNTFRAGFEAARKTRLNGGWVGALTSADQVLQPSRPALNARARDAIRNNSYADSVAQLYRRSMSAITPQAAAYDPATGAKLEAVNRLLDRHFSRWAYRPQFCDLEGIKTFPEMQGLAGEEFCSVGESIVLWSYRPRRHAVGLTLQMIEPEQLATDLEVNPDTGLEVREGIEIDAHGRRVAYHLHRGAHPLERPDARPVRVPASRVIHLMRQRRVRQTHGLTTLSSTLPALHDLDRADQAQILAMWMEACIGLIDKTEDEDDADLGFTGEGGGGGDDSVEGQREEVVFQPGMIARGNYEAFNPSHPNSQYVPFHRHKMHGVAAATGFDYSSITKDFDGSYSSRRQGEVKEWDHRDDLEDLQVYTGLGQAVWDLFVAFAVAEGRVPALPIEAFAEDPLAYTEAIWQARPRPWIDPAREAAAEKIKLDYRLDNRSNYGNRHGLDWRENLDTIAEIRRYAAERGITLPEDLAGAGGGPAVSPHEPRPTRNAVDNDRNADDADGDDALALLALAAREGRA